MWFASDETETDFWKGPHSKTIWLVIELSYLWSIMNKERWYIDGLLIIPFSDMIHRERLLKFENC